MIGFLNDRSLEERTNWYAALRFFLESLQELRPLGRAVFRDSHFFLTGTFKQTFNSLAFPMDVRALVRSLVFTDQYCRCWRPERLSDADALFTCVEPPLELRDESICEAAERKNLNPDSGIVLLSASDSNFGMVDPVSISKQNWPQAVQLRNGTSLATIRLWVTQHRGYYSRESVAPPRDFQTVLEKEPIRFVRTSRYERKFGRRIFEETESRRRYYVDEGHVGHAAHLEVFSADGVHLGVANIDSGELDASRRVEGRRLRL